MALRPLGDVCKVELVVDEFGFGGDETTTGVDNGILVELPDQFNWFGFWSFAFERSFGEAVKLKEFHDYYKQFIGKRVFWPSLSEKGMVFKEGDKKFAIIKITSLIGVAEPDDKVFNLYDEKTGRYAA